MTAGLVSDTDVNPTATTTMVDHAEARPIPILEATIHAVDPEISMTEATREWDVATMKIRRTASVVQTMIDTAIAADMTRINITEAATEDTLQVKTTDHQVAVSVRPAEQITDQAGAVPDMEAVTTKEVIGETGTMGTGITEEETLKNVHGGIAPLTKFPPGSATAKLKEEEKETER
jgi:hypothetical protein